MSQELQILFMYRVRDGKLLDLKNEKQGCLRGVISTLIYFYETSNDRSHGCLERTHQQLPRRGSQSGKASRFWLCQNRPGCALSSIEVSSLNANRTREVEEMSPRGQTEGPCAQRCALHPPRYNGSHTLTSTHRSYLHPWGWCVAWSRASSLENGQYLKHCLNDCFKINSHSVSNQQFKEMYFIFVSTLYWEWKF